MLLPPTEHGTLGSHSLYFDSEPSLIHLTALLVRPLFDLHRWSCTELPLLYHMLPLTGQYCHLTQPPIAMTAPSHVSSAISTQRWYKSATNAVLKAKHQPTSPQHTTTAPSSQHITATTLVHKNSHPTRTRSSQ
jgi:hypothetical protein